MNKRILNIYTIDKEMSEMFGIGMPELVVILVIALVVIGPKNLPEIARVLGKGYGELQKAVKNVRDSVDDVEQDMEKEFTRETPSIAVEDNSSKNNIDKKETRQEEQS